MAKQKTIYYLPRFGQLGNQLSVLAHLLAFSVEYDYKIVHFKSDSLLDILQTPRTEKHLIHYSKWLSQAAFSHVINKMVKLVFLNKNCRILSGLFLNQPFSVDDDFNKNNLPDVIVITDWLFRYYSGVIKHQDELRNLLSFNEVTFTNAREVLATIRNDFPLHTIVGVHVRRGDYATWLGGIYYYNLTTYYQKMKTMATQLENCVFVICTNEEFRFDNECGLHIIYAKGSAAEDMFLLSKCTYIFGPPSTFSSYAAFMGNQNLLFMNDENEDVSINRFSKYYL